MNEEENVSPETGTRIIHADLLDVMRDDAAAGALTDLEAQRIVKALLDHIEAMRSHRCFFKWSAVKAEKHGGPPAVCSACGLPPDPNDVANERWHETQHQVGALHRHVAVGGVTAVVADGTRGMERGR